MIIYDVLCYSVLKQYENRQKNRQKTFWIFCLFYVDALLNYRLQSDSLPKR